MKLIEWINLNRRKLVLVITIGTAILAIPAGVGTIALFDNSGIAGQTLTGTEPLIYISLSGFVIFFGYIFTLLTNKHFRAFWFFSAFYNFLISLAYLFFFLQNLTSNGLDIFGLLITLLPIWTLFISLSSVVFMISPNENQISSLK